LNLETELKALIDLAIQEDGEHDITSESLFQKGETREAVIIAKQDGILSGIRFLQQIAATVDDSILVDPFLEEGSPLKQRMMVAAFEGEVLSLLRAERIMLNFLSRMSGIATMTSQYMKAISGTGAVILDTRKTVPGWRYLDKMAVKSGGGINHRMSLQDVALIKDTHVDIAGGVGIAIEKFLKKNVDQPLIVEVRDMKEFQEALTHVKSLQRIMLDNFTTPMMKEAVDMASGRVLLEASGGITLENARQIAETGVHFLSVGALTHSAPAFDFTFKIS
jgi:nicotinate-nucleotide pyrophosphorylase (carboxylating)